MAAALAEPRTDDGRDSHGSKGFHLASRSVTVTVGVIALLLAGLLATPWGRAQLTLSFGRVLPGHVELYLDPGRNGDACRPPGAPGTARFSVVNHLGHEAALPYTVTVTPQDPSTGTPTGTAAGRAATGTLTVGDGATASTTVRFTAPATRYRIEVTLTGSGERISLTCGRTPNG